MTNPNDDRELNDPDAINDIMEAYDCDEERARELWERFKETIRKLKQNDE